MFEIRLETSELTDVMAELRARVSNISAYFHNVTRPFLLKQFGIEYHRAGYGIRTGRLIQSYVDPTHPEHVSEITGESIIEGTRVPYAVYVERGDPIVSRIARSKALVQHIEQTLQEYITDE